MAKKGEFVEDACEKDGISGLVEEKKEIVRKLAEVGGREFSFLLEDCADLSDIIENIGEVSGKKGKMERAAFESKVKFSRKMRRKAKDLRNFEQKIVEEFEKGHIPLEQGRKMVSIIKLLRSENIEKAKHEAEEFYAFLEMGDRLKEINDQISKKRAQIERNFRMFAEQMADIEWLEAQPVLDTARVARHEKRLGAKTALVLAREEHLRALSATPLCALIANEKAEELLKLGFPIPSKTERDALGTFLYKSGLEGKSASELCGMIGENEQKLRHLGIDLASFRVEIVSRKDFLTKMMFLHTGGFLSGLEGDTPAIDYLARHSNAASQAKAELLGLAGTENEDRTEWERAKLIEKKRAGLSGANKSEIGRRIKELEGIKSILDGKTEPDAVPNEKENVGFIDRLFRLFNVK